MLPKIFPLSKEQIELLSNTFSELGVDVTERRVSEVLEELFIIMRTYLYRTRHFSTLTISNHSDEDYARLLRAVNKLEAELEAEMEKKRVLKKAFTEQYKDELTGIYRALVDLLPSEELYCNAHTNL